MRICHPLPGKPPNAQPAVKEKREEEVGMAAVRGGVLTEPHMLANSCNSCDVFERTDWSGPAFLINVADLTKKLSNHSKIAKIFGLSISNHPTKAKFMTREASKLALSLFPPRCETLSSSFFVLFFSFVSCFSVGHISLFLSESLHILQSYSPPILPFLPTPQRKPQLLRCRFCIKSSPRSDTRHVIA